MGGRAAIDIGACVRSPVPTSDLPDKRSMREGIRGCATLQEA